MVEKLVFIPIIIGCLYACTKNKITNVLLSVLRWFGKYTLELYVLHLLVWCFFGNKDFFPTMPIEIHLALMIGIPIIICAPAHKICMNFSDRIIIDK